MTSSVKPEVHKLTYVS